MSFGPASPDAGVELLRQLFLQCEGGGRGADSYDRKKAWSSVNDSILSAIHICIYRAHAFSPFVAYGPCTDKKSRTILHMRKLGSLMQGNAQMYISLLRGGCKSWIFFIFDPFVFFNSVATFFYRALCFFL